MSENYHKPNVILICTELFATVSDAHLEIYDSQGEST
jgi:hypothetical protein